MHYDPVKKKDGDGKITHDKGDRLFSFELDQISRDNPVGREINGTVGLYTNDTSPEASSRGPSPASDPNAVRRESSKLTSLGTRETREAESLRSSCPGSRSPTDWDLVTHT